MENRQFVEFKTLKGHNGWVTSIAPNPKNDESFVTGSRDNTLIIWQLDSTEPEESKAIRSLKGHSGFIQDLLLSLDGQYAISASWDKTLRLWELSSGKTVRRFVGHTNDVLSVSISSTNRQIVTCSRDKTIKLWNTLGECKNSFESSQGHSDWISCVKFSPNVEKGVLVSCGWDGLVKVWNIDTMEVENTFVGHDGAVNTIAISPEGSICVSGGKDGVVMVWDLNRRIHSHSFVAGFSVNCLAVPVNRYWVAAGTDRHLIVWDLGNKKVIAKITNPSVHDKDDSKHKSSKVSRCLSVSFSTNCVFLFAGYSNGQIKVFKTRDISVSDSV